MDRNTEINQNSLPIINYGRSLHEYNVPIKTSLNTGMLVPFWSNELVQPGDTFTIDLGVVIRMNTPYQPVMDLAYADFYCFAIDWLDIWNDTKPFWGENTLGAWKQTTEYAVPKISIQAQQDKNSILSYLNIARPYFAYNTTNATIGGKLSLNAYDLTYNEWFRDQNYIAPREIDFSSANRNVTYNLNCYNVAKFHDRYTTPLPEPQKGDNVGIPLGTSAPVYGTQYGLSLTTGGLTAGAMANYGGGDNEGYPSFTQPTYMNEPVGTTVSNSQIITKSVTNKIIGLSTKEQIANFNLPPEKSGLYTDLAGAISATLNAQRLALTINHISEKMGLYGSRYREIIKSMWGVDSKDKAQHIPEYLGGKRIPISVKQVTNTSLTGYNLGETGATSWTVDTFRFCNKSFTEHSVLLGLVCIRTEQGYGQGIRRQFLKSKKYDYYWHEFRGLGFQPVYNAELLFQGNDEDMLPLGYLPAWDEYRKEDGYATGEFAPDYPQWLGQWTYNNKLANLPVMGKTWIEESPKNVDRTLAVQSSTSHQFIMSINLHVKKRSIVQQYGVPGVDKF